MWGRDDSSTTKIGSSLAKSNHHHHHHHHHHRQRQQQQQQQQQQQHTTTTATTTTITTGGGTAGQGPLTPQATTASNQIEHCVEIYLGSRKSAARLLECLGTEGLGFRCARAVAGLREARPNLCPRLRWSTWSSLIYKESYGSGR